MAYCLCVAVLTLRIGLKGVRCDCFFVRATETPFSTGNCVGHSEAALHSALLRNIHVFLSVFLFLAKFSVLIIVKS
jgi:hypothetical protein